ncbi:MAG: YraN family protein [Candidatus Adiutrix sp.]
MEKSVDKRHQLGRRGEDLAAKHLQGLGYKIIGRNVVNCIGEIDLVALDGPTVVITEVKTRSKHGLPPSLSVDFRKQRKLSLVALLFLKNRKWENKSARFDVVEVICPPEGAPLIKHIKNAFELVG